MATITLNKAQLQARAKAATAAYAKPKLKKKKSVADTLDNTKTAILPPPMFNDIQRHNQRVAAQKYALAYNADPYAYNRIMLYMRMGYDDSASVMSHADAVLAVRSSHHAKQA